MDKNSAISFLRSYINSIYVIESMKVRELKHDNFTDHWTAHVSFTDMEKSHEMAIMFDDERIIFVKEFE